MQQQVPISKLVSGDERMKELIETALPPGDGEMYAYSQQQGIPSQQSVYYHQPVQQGQVPPTQMPPGHIPHGQIPPGQIPVNQIPPTAQMAPITYPQVYRPQRQTPRHTPYQRPSTFPLPQPPQPLPYHPPTPPSHTPPAHTSHTTHSHSGVNSHSSSGVSHSSSSVGQSAAEILEKRAEQNRKAQRTFRKRRQEYIQTLEKKSKFLDQHYLDYERHKKLLELFREKIEQEGRLEKGWFMERMSDIRGIEVKDLGERLEEFYNGE